MSKLLNEYFAKSFNFKSNNLHGELIPVSSWPLVVINGTVADSRKAKLKQLQ